MRPLDVHCEIDDGFALCVGNKVPRVPVDLFLQLAQVTGSSARFPWLRCSRCVVLLTPAAVEVP